MVVSEITLFNTLKAKLGEHDAQVVVEGIKNAVKEEFNTSKEVLATKQDIGNLKTDIERLRAELLVVKWMLGVVLAGIISLILKAFFS